MHKPDARRRPGIPCQIEALCTARMPQELEDPQPIVTCARSPHQGITTNLPAGRSTPAANHDGRSNSESVSASVSAAGRRCGLDGGLHRGSFAWDPGPNLTRKPHEPWVCSPLSGKAYGAPVHRVGPRHGANSGGGNEPRFRPAAEVKNLVYSMPSFASSSSVEMRCFRV